MSALPRKWQVATTAEVCTLVQSGGTPKAGFLDAPGVPFLKVYNIVGQKVSFDYKPQFVADVVHSGELRKSKIVPGDVLMNIVGPPLGKVAIVPDTYPEWNANQAITVFRPGGAVTSDWLYYFLCGGSSVRSVINETRGSAGQVNISLSQCRAFEIPLPTVPEQRRIVAKIHGLTGKSRRARDHLDHIPRLVENYKQAVLAAAFRGQLTDGVAPLVTLGSICGVRSGFAFPSSDFLEIGPAPVIRIGNISDGHIQFTEGTKYLPAEFLRSHSAFTVQRGDILVALSGATTGKSGAYTHDHPALLNQRVARLRLDDPQDRTLVKFFLQRIRGDVLDASYGGAQPNISPQKLAAFQLIWPIAEERKRLAEQLTAAMFWIDRLVSEATNAGRLIDKLDHAVLTKAFRGELVPQDPTDEPARLLL